MSIAAMFFINSHASQQHFGFAEDNAFDAKLIRVEVDGLRVGVRSFFRLPTAQFTLKLQLDHSDHTNGAGKAPRF